jgi:hypothetical protein
MGASNSKSETETINWDKLKTENMSSTNANFNGLSNEAKDLIASLNIPEITQSETSEFTVSHILDKINTGLTKEDKSKFNQLLNKVSVQNGTEDLSTTSPFISSEMYEYLLNSKSSEENKQKNKQTNKQTGGTKKGGAWDDNDESDTSSTSSDSSLEDILDSTEEEVMKQKQKKDKQKKQKKAQDSEMSGGELSYLSSSAHTGGDFSDSNTNNKSETHSVESSVESSSENQTSSYKNSITDENKDMATTSISVNTDDINMVSDY